ncbi:MAG: HK97 gp10 family phage protein [Propionibacteriaceae bacterium]|nr:HK97 gp10 family phage protein [Propionibacteriaceae bacterium]
MDLTKAAGRVQRAAPLIIRKTAADIERDAKLFAPVDTGFLRSSIGIDSPDPMEAVIGPTAEYAPFLEFGTAHMAPHAFMGPAFDRHSGDFVAAFDQLSGGIL